MNDELFNELLSSIEEAGAIRRGEKPAARTMRYVGHVLVEITEYGECTWSLTDAARALSEKMSPGSVALLKPDPKLIREALNQSQAGFAELLNVSVKTVRNWEQGLRVPRGPGASLLRLAARHPEALLETLQATRGEAA